MSFDLLGVRKALTERGFDGWLFYDFRGSDPLAYSILGLAAEGHRSRRWFYYVPARGEPTKVVHAIEAGALDGLPGSKCVYLPWTDLASILGRTLAGHPRIAMQYSPNNAIPYVSRVDAGTIELVRSLGATVETSAELVQIFEATLSAEQYATHLFAADAVASLCQEAFDEIGRRLHSQLRTTEFDIQQFLVKRFDDEGLVTDHPPIVAVDSHSADPHFAPSSAGSTEMRPGQTVLIDLWAKRQESGSIFADITRVAVIGGAVPEEYGRIFTIVRDARDAAIEAIQSTIRAGRTMRGCDLDDVCRSVIREAGYGDFFIHRTGHSIHESTHGNGANIDNLETRDERMLIPRTVFSIEPGIYFPGQFGVRSEINVYIAEKDAIVTGPPRQKEVHRIEV